MKFNYGLEKKKFDEKWAKMEKEYRDAGMSEEAIDEMRRYDWEDFKRERAYRRHTLLVDVFSDDCSDGHMDSNGEGCSDHSLLLKKFAEQLMTIDPEWNMSRKLGWIDSVNDEHLAKAIASLSDRQLETLSLSVIDEYTVRDIAQLQGRSKSAVHESLISSIKKIKKYFE